FVPEEQAGARAPGLAGRLTRLGEERVFVLHWLGEPGDVSRSIYLSQRDVRELQFAKAAIATGWRILLEEAGLAPGDVQQVLLAGAVGRDLFPAKAVRLRPGPGVRGVPVGSARGGAGGGGETGPLSAGWGGARLGVVEEVRYGELSDRADFNDRFVAQLPFPG